MVKVFEYISEGESESLFSRCLKKIRKKKYYDALKSIDKMISDLKINGHKSRYIKSIGEGLFELKTTSRGGQVGGARVYGFFAGESFVILGAAEVKKDVAADAELIIKVKKQRAEWYNRNKGGEK